MENTSTISFSVYPTGYGAISAVPNQVLFATLFCISFTIAGGFAWYGLWMILPFAGIEMLVLAIALYMCRRRLMYREVIRVDDDNVSVSVGHTKMEKQCVLQRAWSKVLILPTAGEHSCRLWIRSHGKQVEIGKCLSFDDKRALAFAIARAIKR